MPMKTYTVSDTVDTFCGIFFFQYQVDVVNSCQYDLCSDGVMLLSSPNLSKMKVYMFDIFRKLWYYDNVGKYSLTQM